MSADTDTATPLFFLNFQLGFFANNEVARVLESHSCT